MFWSRYDERLAGFQGFQPQGDLGQFDGHGVDVYAVDAAADYAAEGLADLGLGGFGFAGFFGGDALGDAAGCRYQEVAGAAGGVADGQVEQRRDLLFGGAVGCRLVEQGIEGGVEEALDQGGGRVVGARLLALVAGEHRERVGAVVGVVVGDQLQEGLVDAAEFFRAEVAEVDAAHRAAVAGLDQGQGADRAEEGLVGQAGACQGLVQGEGAAVVAAGLEDAADAGEGQLGDAAFGTEAVEDELDRLEEVGVAGAALPAGQVAEPAAEKYWW